MYYESAQVNLDGCLAMIRVYGDRLHAGNSGRSVSSRESVVISY